MASKVRPGSRIRLRWILGGLSIVLLIGLYAARHVTTQEKAQVARGGPPWIYGPTEARFSVIGYADLECPYCRDYFPVLLQWIKAHSDVNWQWHHLPLPTHEPNATVAARLAECAGEIGGNTAFWNAVTWLYEHDGHEVAELIKNAGLNNGRVAFESCVDTARPDALIRSQAIEASRDGVRATPTLRLVDRKTGRDILLPGPTDGDVLLSAIDFLLTPEDAQTNPSEH